MFHLQKNQILHLFPIFVLLFIPGLIVALGVYNSSITVMQDVAVAVHRELYVSLSGSDSNPVTINAPFCTFAKAISMLSPDTTLYIRGGQYHECFVVSIVG